YRLSGTATKALTACGQERILLRAGSHQWKAVGSQAVCEGDMGDRNRPRWPPPTRAGKRSPLPGSGNELECKRVQPTDQSLLPHGSRTLRRESVFRLEKEKPGRRDRKEIPRSPRCRGRHRRVEDPATRAGGRQAGRRDSGYRWGIAFLR